jgi:hypothetical protein
MEANYQKGLENQYSKSHNSESQSDPQKSFEVLLSQEQVKQIQKLLPVGYSLAISKKQFGSSFKRAISKESTRDENFQNNPNIQRQKRRAYREAEMTFKGNGDFAKKCKTIIDLLRKHPSAEPFLRPVDPIALRIPDYLEIVKEPMDLGTISKRLFDEFYESQEAFEADVRCVWKNAFTYNLPNTQIYRMTEELSTFFEKILTEATPKLDSVAPVRENLPKAVHKKTTEYNENAALPPRYPKPVSHGPKTSYNDKPLSYAEKKNLSQMIRQLPPDCLWDVWKIVAPNNQNHGNEELEFDIDTLPLRTARELETFVRNKVSQNSKKKMPIKKVGSTNEFNMPGSYANLNNVGAIQTTTTNGSGFGGPIPPSFADLDRQAQNPKKKVEEGDQESSFISSLDDSDY